MGAEMAATEQRALAGPREAPSLLGLWRTIRTNGPPLFVSLPALLIAIAMALPLLYLVIRSVGASSEAWDLLLRPRTAQILGRSMLLVTTVTTLCLAIALPLAWLTVRTDLPLRRTWGVLTALPLVIPSYVGAFLVISVLGPKGLVQGLLSGPFGVDRLPNIYGLAGATMTLTLLSYPYVLLTVRSVLANLDPALEESARSLGAGPMRVQFRVVLPLLRPAAASGGLLVGLYTLADFGAVSLLRYETFTWAIYQQYQSAFDRSIAAVLSLVLVALAVGVLLVEARSRGKLRYHRSTPGVRRLPRIVHLGKWRWPALAFCGAIVLFALILPMSVLGYWVVRGMASGEGFDALWSATWNSVFVSAIAAVVVAALSIPVAVLAVRYPSLPSRIIERLTFTGYALPGIVVALALVFFGTTLALPIYQTIWLLLIAYIVLFFPAALGATRSALLQVSPRLEESARGLGRGQLRTLKDVTVPLMRSGVAAGAALVFLITMKELPATLILGPLGFKTLATSIWSASSEAFFARAAAPALVLILLSSVPMALLMLRDRKVRL
jgi:iron(III) transport system permease protein